MHKLIFSTLLTFKISLKADKINSRKLSFLIEGKKGELDEINTTTKEILKDYQIENVKGLEELEILLIIRYNYFKLWNTYWRKWLKDEKAEKSKMP